MKRATKEVRHVNKIGRRERTKFEESVKERQGKGEGGREEDTEKENTVRAIKI